MRTQRLSPAEREALEKVLKRRTKLFWLIAGANLIALIVLLVMFPEDLPFRPFIIGGFILFDIIGLYIFSRLASKVKADLLEQVKHTGSYRILRKQEIESSSFIEIDAEGKRSFPIPQNIYNEISEGEEYFFEFAKSSNHLFTISKDDRVIYSHHS